MKGKSDWIKLILLCGSPDTKKNHCYNFGYLLKTNICVQLSKQSNYRWYFQLATCESSFSLPALIKRMQRNRQDVEAELRVSETSLIPRILSAKQNKIPTNNDFVCKWIGIFIDWLQVFVLSTLSMPKSCIMLGKYDFGYYKYLFYSLQPFVDVRWTFKKFLPEHRCRKSGTHCLRPVDQFRAPATLVFLCWYCDHFSSSSGWRYRNLVLCQPNRI